MQNAWQSANAAAKLLPGLPAGMLLVEPQEPNWKQQLGALTPSNNWSCIYELAFRNQNWLWKITISSVHIRYVRLCKYMICIKGCFSIAMSDSWRVVPKKQ